jgi:hypothetical protein
MPPAYTADQLVEQSAIGLLAELGWITVSALAEVFTATLTLKPQTPGAMPLGSESDSVQRPFVRYAVEARLSVSLLHHLMTARLRLPGFEKTLSD